MDVHRNAQLTQAGREIMVDQIIAGQTPKAAAAKLHTSIVTARRPRRGSSARRNRECWRRRG